QRIVRKSIKVARKIVGHFKHSLKACEELGRYRIQLNLPKHSILQDVKTSWNSTLIMIHRLKQRQAVLLYAADYPSVGSLSSNQWTILKAMTHILGPFD
ncbi:hypothetical protein CAPTEDRAFT_87389, partial [Capitella teleta]